MLKILTEERDRSLFETLSVPFSGRKMHLYPCARIREQSFELMFFFVAIPKVEIRFIVEIPIHQFYVLTTVHALISRFHKFIKE